MGDLIDLGIKKSKMLITETGIRGYRRSKAYRTLSMVWFFACGDQCRFCLLAIAGDVDYHVSNVRESRRERGSERREEGGRALFIYLRFFWKDADSFFISSGRAELRAVDRSTACAQRAGSCRTRPGPPKWRWSIHDTWQEIIKHVYRLVETHTSVNASSTYIMVCIRK